MEAESLWISVTSSLAFHECMGSIFRTPRQLRPIQPPPISSHHHHYDHHYDHYHDHYHDHHQQSLSHAMAQPTLLFLPRRGLATNCQFLSLCSPIRTSTRTFLTSRTQTLPRYQCQRQQQQQQILSQSLNSSRQRKYHSRHHPAAPHDYTNSQTTILSAALAHVPSHGFTHDALTLGARDAGFLDVSVQLLRAGNLIWCCSGWQVDGGC